MDERFEEEIRRYGNAVLKYCFGMLCDYHEAQDAMQETFAKAYRARQSLKEQEKYSAWLYKIAYNVCLNILRGRKRRFLLSFSRSDDNAEAGKNEGVYYMPEPFIEPVLQEALMTLNPLDRAIFYSRAVEDMEYSEIEKLYDIRSAALRKRFERAKKKLKTYLEGECVYE
jgi:RNA polymerase sigma-70 factor (ECF subfamily)